MSDGAKRILSDLEKHPEAIASIKDLDTPPKPLSRRPPVYPTAFLAGRKEGQAMIEFYIDKKGDAQLPSVVSSSAPEFGYAAVQAVATWRFEPPKKKGKAVATRVRVPISFAQDVASSNQSSPPRS